MKIHFFGASVTAQSFNHATQEATGYYPILRQLLLDNHLFSQVDATTAGSSHFNGAGYCLLDEVLSHKPDVVALEWHTTSLRYFDPSLWRSCISKIIESGAFCIVVILPRKDLINTWRDDPCINQALSLSKEIKGYAVINLYESLGSININLDICLRDICHTNNLGARAYAELLLRKISYIHKDIRPGGSLLPAEARIQSKHMEVHRLEVSPDYSTSSHIDFMLLFEPEFTLKSIIVDHMIGPFSPVCEIYIGNEIIGQWCAWDSYCYYQRQTYATFPHKIFTSESTKNQVTVKVSNNTRPRYADCRKLDFDHSLFTADQLKIRSIYVIGSGVTIFSSNL